MFIVTFSHIGTKRQGYINSALKVRKCLISQAVWNTRSSQFRQEHLHIVVLFRDKALFDPYQKENVVVAVVRVSVYKLYLRSQ